MASAPTSTDSPETPPLPTDRIAHFASLAGAATLISRVLGLVRDTVLAGVFGAGNEMDAFLVAFRIPNLARDLFAEGAMSAAFVPTFTRRVTLRGKADAWRLGSNVLNVLLVVTGAAVAAGCVFATPLVTAYAGDYASIPGKLELTARLARVMLPFLTLVALAAAVMGMLNALGHYFMPALSPSAFNVATIACALLLAPLMPAIGEPPIMAVALAVIFGGIGQIALQWIPLRREGFRHQRVFDLGDPDLRHMLLMMGPGTLGLAATQVNLFVNTLLATSQGTGAVSWLQYAFRLMYLPIGLFGVSIATAVLPAVARQATLGDTRAVSRTVARGIALMLIVNVPATVGLLVLAAPIVRLLLERGRFLPADTLATAAAVQCYAVGLVGYSAARIASPVFYALGRTRVVVAMSVTSMAVNLALSLALVRTMGFRGLALATSLAAIANGGLSLGLLARELGGLDARRLVTTLVKIGAASAAMALVVSWSSTRLSSIAPGEGTAMQALRLSTAIAAGLVTLSVAGGFLGISEMADLRAELRARVRGIGRPRNDPPRPA